MTHICVSNRTINGSDNGLSPNRHQTITWTNAGIFIIRPLGTNFSEILIEFHTFSLKKMHFKWSSGKWRPFCPGLNVLMKTCDLWHDFSLILLYGVWLIGIILRMHPTNERECYNVTVITHWLGAYTKWSLIDVKSTSVGRENRYNGITYTKRCFTILVRF